VCFPVPSFAPALSRFQIETNAFFLFSSFTTFKGGVLIDNEEAVKKIKEEYWDPMWKHSYTGKDVDVQAVMDGLDIDRDGENPDNVSPEQKAEAARAQTVFPSQKFVLDHESDDEEEQGKKVAAKKAQGKKTQQARKR